MNNLIKALAMQCWDERLDGLHFDQEKFAQLIVQECIDVCDAYGMPDGTSPVAMIIASSIKNKFSNVT